MTRSDLLRQALEPTTPDDVRQVLESGQVILDAARFALKVWEGDQQLVERVAAALLERDERSLDGLIGSWAVEVKAPYLAEARAVLAAITEEGEK